MEQTGGTQCGPEQGQDFFPNRRWLYPEAHTAAGLYFLRLHGRRGRMAGLSGLGDSSRCPKSLLLATKPFSSDLYGVQTPPEERAFFISMETRRARELCLDA